MRCNDVKRLAAVRRKRVYRAALRPDKCQRCINDSHYHASEETGCNCVARDSGRIINAQSAYCRYNNYTECKTRERIHGIVAVKKALKYRSALVCRLRCNVSRFADGRDERRNDKQAECHKEQRSQYFAYPCENLARA